MNRALLFTIQCALTGLLAFLPLPSIPAAAQQTPLYFPPVRAQPSPADQELLQACSNGDTEKIADLLQRGANPNAGNGAPLHLAASHGRAQSVEILLKSGANPRTPDSDGKTPLHHAVHHDITDSTQYSSVVQLLLEHGADPNAKANDGNTPLQIPLHAAASGGETKLVQLLLSAGANPNLTSKHGRVPLHHAVNLDCAKLLVEAGAKVDFPDQLGITPLRWAAMVDNKPIYDFLLATYGGKEPPRKLSLTPPTAYAQTPTGDLLSGLSLAGPDVNTVHEELLRRGKAVVPDVLKCIQSGKPIGNYWYLLGALGPDAEGALPVLVAELANKTQVYSAIKTINAIKPGTFANLPEATQNKASETLYHATLAEDDVMVYQFIGLLTKIGKPAIPALLLLFKNPRDHVRNSVSEALWSTDFSDQTMEMELFKLAQNDENPLVRHAAIQSLAYFAKPDERARAYLLAFLKNPPPQHDLGEWSHIAESIALALSRFGPGIIDDLIPFLSPLNQPQRAAAIRALQGLGVKGIPRLAEMQLDKDQAIATAANVALDSIGGAWTRLLLASSDSKDDLPILLAVAGTERYQMATRLSAAFYALTFNPSQSRNSLATPSIILLIAKALESTGAPDQQIRAAQVARQLGSAARDTLPALRRCLSTLPPGITALDDNDRFSKTIRSAITAIEADIAARER